jgi:GxxExxY protein
VAPQSQFEVHYDGQLIGTLIPDLIVDDLVIADPKVVTAFNDTHIAQMIGYLNITALKLALLLNFKNARRSPGMETDRPLMAVSLSVLSV